MQARTTPSTQRDELLADVVVLAQSISRQVHTAPVDDPDLISLTQVESLAMQHIDRHPGERVTELAATLGLKSSNASTALRDLERKGMIRRQADPSDRRASTVWPTTRARENLVRVRAQWARMLAAVGLTDGELETMVGLLHAVEARLSTSASTPVPDPDPLPRPT